MADLGPNLLPGFRLKRSWSSCWSRIHVFFNVLIDFGHRLSASDIYVMIYVQALTYSGFHRKSVSCASDFKYYRAAIFGGCLWQALISIYKVNFARDIGLALALRAAVVCRRRISLCPGRALWRAVVGRPSLVRLAMCYHANSSANH